MMNTTINFVQNLLFKWEYFSILAILLIFGEYILCTLIIHKIPYTEIDWRAYMQEVEGPFVHNDWNYTNLGGDTGPLVYPAGFVYIYEGLRRVVDWNPVTEEISPEKAQMAIMTGQWIFKYIYLLQQALVLAVYGAARPKNMPPWVCILLCLSKRIHSIFVLRLFNDGIAMVFLYGAILLFTKKRWTIGCILFSLAFSVKMNIILFAPALFLLLLKSTGFLGTICNILLCAIIQVLLGLPFMMTDFWGYINGSFELGRVFKFKWTVNWKFLTEEFFVSKQLALSLLLLTAIFMLYFGNSRWTKQEGGIYQLLIKKISALKFENNHISSEHIVITMMTCNFIGIMFCRSLHYQFYCWYFHTIPFLLWRNEKLPYLLRIFVFVGLEWTWGYNFPATPISSAILHLAHVILFISLITSKIINADVGMIQEAKKD